MKKWLFTPLLVLSTSVALSNTIDFVGNVRIKIPLNQSLTGTMKEITLPQFKLSKKTQGKIIARTKASMPSLLVPDFGELPIRVKLGMQGTPVLDQGMHGSCVTFAVTAALDALLGAGDYISQLCNLELGAYLSAQGKSEYSGWNGAFGSGILSQISQYGVLSKNYQRIYGCAGVRDYNLDDELDEGSLMSDSEFNTHSIPVGNMVSWKSLVPALDSPEAASPRFMWQVLFDTKQAIAQGHRVSIGMLLDQNLANAGAVGQMHVPHDTWMLTPEIAQDLLSDLIWAGHEMVITGYDDTIEVTDDAGHSSRGVFTLRNSWSMYAGDQGNYYVTYEYFRVMVDEAYELALKNKTA